MEQGNFGEMGGGNNENDMKSLLVSILIFPTMVAADDFRGVGWGVTMEQVIGVEGPPDLKGSEWIVYTDTLAGLDARYAFGFFDGRLDRGMYSFTEEHANKNEFISDFRRLETLLDDKYGYGSAQKEEFWSNDLYKDDYQNRGRAISVGHYSIFDIYITDTTEIKHQLTGDNYETRHVILYQSLATKDARKSQADAKEKDKL